MAQVLGNVQIQVDRFKDLEGVIQKLKKIDEKIDRKKSEHVNRELLALIVQEPEHSFLLPAVLEFVARVDQEKILHHYTFNSFEIWLNQLSGLNFEDNCKIRAKIAGKKITREDYQILFPIGMDRIFKGTHFVTAHKSPDLDTTIASFWGWLDAFAARVSDGLHVWNLPDGPIAQIEMDWIFRELLGPGVFTHLPKTRHVLNLTGNDLMTQKGMVRKTYADSIAQIDHERDFNAVVVVDEEGFYLGDWRSTDVEGVRQVIILLGSCLRWFENSLHLGLISLFTKPQLFEKDFAFSVQRLLDMHLTECGPALDFSKTQKQHVDEFLKRVIGMKKGLQSTFEELAIVLCNLSQVPFGGIDGLIEKMSHAQLFDAKGRCTEDRPRIFSFLEGSIQSLHLAIVKIRARLERLDIAMKTKYEVFGHHPTYITAHSDVGEIQDKMGNHSYLTVVYPDQGRHFPVGVIQAPDLRKTTLATASLRDFCNRDEMGIPSYVDIISVIDHHKTALHTVAPLMAILSDAQSSNTLVAQKAFEINAKAEFVHPVREYIENLHFLYAILDDTDLLSKVTIADVESVAAIMNRLKQLAAHKKSEVIHFNGLVRDSSFPKKAAKRILQNKDMYSIYSKIYRYKEKEVDKNIALAAAGKPSNFFIDTKEQNGCCRVGQTKMFALNFSKLQTKLPAIRSHWVKRAQKVHAEKPEIDLHLHMISTVVSAKEVYRGSDGEYKHLDEIWIWVPQTDTAIEHLKRFLGLFQGSPGLKNNKIEVEFLGSNADALSAIFHESFLEIPHKKMEKGLNIAVLKFKPGSMNSRKAVVTPFLPVLGG